MTPSSSDHGSVSCRNPDVWTPFTPDTTMQSVSDSLMDLDSDQLEEQSVVHPSSSCGQIQSTSLFHVTLAKLNHFLFVDLIMQLLRSLQLPPQHKTGERILVCVATAASFTRNTVWEAQLLIHRLVSEISAATFFWMEFGLWLESRTESKNAAETFFNQKQILSCQRAPWGTLVWIK